MKLAIIGSRTFNDYERMCNEILTLFTDKIECIVSGGAKGADSLGERYAKERDIQTIILKPDWNKYGRSAGFIRNHDIIKTCTHVIAFWDGQSKGTKHSIDLAKQLGKPCWIVKF